MIEQLIGNELMISSSKVGEEPGDWLTTFALLTECTDAKFCNTTSQVDFFTVTVANVGSVPRDKPIISACCGKKTKQI